MSFLKKHFSKSINQCSPAQKDYVRVVKTDGDTEVIEWKEVDYRKLQRSLGTIGDWNLDTLLKAGVNPDFPIHTGNGTRLEGLNSLKDFEAEADAIFADMQPNDTLVEDNK